MVWDPPKYYMSLDGLALGQILKNTQMPYRETTVFGKRHTGIPLCSDPMIQNIIRPQIGLPQDKYFKHAIQVGHEQNCAWGLFMSDGLIPATLPIAYVCAYSELSRIYATIE